MIALVLASGIYWQGFSAARELVQSAGDDSTQRGYYEPLAGWLHDHGGDRARIEVPTTLNSWESAYLAPDFQLARGWLRQLDRTRSSLFYEGRLTNARYRAWLARNGVRYVALADAPIHETAAAERRLILRQPNYLKPVWSSEHWQVYEFTGARPLVRGLDGARARLGSINTTSFTLDVAHPGTFRVLVRSSPFWELSGGRGCVGEHGKWTTVRAPDPGAFASGSASRCPARGARRRASPTPAEPSAGSAAPLAPRAARIALDLGDAPIEPAANLAHELRVARAAA